MTLEVIHHTVTELQTDSDELMRVQALMASARGTGASPTASGAAADLGNFDLFRGGALRATNAPYCLFHSAEAQSRAPVAAATGTYFSGSRRYSIDALAVDKTHRRRGLGTAVVAHMLSEAEQLGASEVQLNVSRENPGAIALYERAGFKSVDDPGRDMSKYVLMATQL